MIVKDMTRQQCLDVLSASRLGRLACVRDNQPYVVPIYCVFGDNNLYSFSRVGQKIEWMRANPHVCVQIDQFTQAREWRSVVAYGRYEELADSSQWVRERLHAWSLLQMQANWWEPGGLKPSSQSEPGASPYLFYRIRIERLTGRQAIAGD
jgi:uncharacterized protein